MAEIDHSCGSTGPWRRRVRRTARRLGRAAVFAAVRGLGGAVGWAAGSMVVTFLLWGDPMILRR